MQLNLPVVPITDLYINDNDLIAATSGRSFWILDDIAPFQIIDEIDDLKILQALEKKKYLITLPKIKKNNQMDFFEWSFTQPLIINKYGIYRSYNYDKAKKSSVTLEDLRLPTQFVEKLMNEN